MTDSIHLTCWIMCACSGSLQFGNVEVDCGLSDQVLIKCERITSNNLKNDVSLS